MTSAFSRPFHYCLPWQISELSPARIDMAKLSSIYEKNNPTIFHLFLKMNLADSLNGDPLMLEKPQDVVLYGFGLLDAWWPAY